MTDFGHIRSTVNHFGCGGSMEGAQFVSSIDPRLHYGRATLSDSFWNSVYNLRCAILFSIFTCLGFQQANFIITLHISNWRQWQASEIKTQKNLWENSIDMPLTHSSFGRVCMQPHGSTWSRITVKLHYVDIFLRACVLAWLLHAPIVGPQINPRFQLETVTFIVAFRSRSNKPSSSEDHNLTYVVTLHLRLHTPYIPNSSSPSSWFDILTNWDTGLHCITVSKSSPAMIHQQSVGRVISQASFFSVSLLRSFRLP